jgi:hypothetical protein
MAAKITRLSLRELWSSEYTLFVNQFITIFQKYPIGALHLTKAFGRVTALLPQLAKIKAQELSNAITNQLRDLDNERDTLIKAIVEQMKALGKLSLSSVAPHVVVMNRFLDIHGRYVASANYSSETNRLNDLLADYDGKTDVQAAAAALNLKMLFDQLRVVNTQFASLFLQRTAEDATVEKVDTQAIRTEIDKALTAFVDAFEFCSAEYEELDYATPANELNVLTKYYKAQLKARSTRRNSGIDVSTEKPIASKIMKKKA